MSKIHSGCGKVIVAELVKKFAVYGTQRFITVFIRTHLWPLS
jgi:hypothetical protein